MATRSYFDISEAFSCSPLPYPTGRNHAHDSPLPTVSSSNNSSNSSNSNRDDNDSGPSVRALCVGCYPLDLVQCTGSELDSLVLRQSNKPLRHAYTVPSCIDRMDDYDQREEASEGTHLRDNGPLLPHLSSASVGATQVQTGTHDAGTTTKLRARTSWLRPYPPSADSDASQHRPDPTPDAGHNRRGPPCLPALDHVEPPRTQRSMSTNAAAAAVPKLGLIRRSYAWSQDSLDVIRSVPFETTPVDHTVASRRLRPRLPPRIQESKPLYAGMDVDADAGTNTVAVLPSPTSTAILQDEFFAPNDSAVQPDSPHTTTIYWEEHINDQDQWSAYFQPRLTADQHVFETPTRS